MNSEDKDFLTDKLNYAMVVTGTHEDIRKLKEQIVLMNIQVIYQKTSYGELTIIKGSDHEQQ